MTARELITDALIDANVVAEGETPDASTISAALRILNRMLSSWSAKKLLIYQITRETFTLVVGQGSRTIGTGGDFSTSRPEDIYAAGLIINSTEYPVDILKSFKEWAEIPDKSTTSPIISKLYYEPEFPLGKIYFYPVPSAANSLVLYTKKPFLALTLDSSVSLPSGYEEAIVSNLTIKIAPRFGKSVDPLIFQEAKESKAAIMKANRQPVIMASDIMNLTSRKPYNIYAGK